MFDVFCWCLKWCLMMFDDVWWCVVDVLRMLNVLVLKFYSSCCLIVAFQSSTSIANIPSTVVAVALFPSPKKDWWWWWQWCFWGDWCSQPPSTTARWPKDGLHGIFRAMGVSPSTGAEAATSTWGLTAGQRSEQVGGKAGCWGCTECCLKDLWEVKNFCEICWFRPTLGPRWGTRMFELGLRLYIYISYYFLDFLRIFEMP